MEEREKNCEFRRGVVPDDRKLWSATAVVNQQYHSELREVHRSFLQSGAKAITTNSYGIIPGVGFDQRDELVQHVQTAARIAKEALGSNNDNDDVGFEALVLGSCGPLVESYRADLIMSHEEGAKYYQAITEALSSTADVFLAETMSCFEESAQAIDGATGTANMDHCRRRRRPAMMVSYTLGSNGALRGGEKVTECITKLLDYTQQKDKQVELLGVLFNCAEPEAISSALREIHHGDNVNLAQRLQEHNVRLGAYANRLTPVPDNWTIESSDGPQPFRTDLNPQEYYDDFVQEWVSDFNVRIIGGCCGITPEHIAYLHKQLQDKLL